MEKPTKQILYRPNQNTKPDVAAKKEVKKEEPKVEVPTEINEGVKIANWLKTFSLLNKSALCKEANVDRGNLDKYLQKGVIPDQHIESIKKVIKDYGYTD